MLNRMTKNVYRLRLKKIKQIVRLTIVKKINELTSQSSILNGKMIISFSKHAFGLWLVDMGSSSWCLFVGPTHRVTMLSSLISDIFFEIVDLSIASSYLLTFPLLVWCVVSNYLYIFFF